MRTLAAKGQIILISIVEYQANHAKDSLFENHFPFPPFHFFSFHTENCPPWTDIWNPSDATQRKCGATLRTSSLKHWSLLILSSNIIITPAFRTTPVAAPASRSWALMSCWTIVFDPGSWRWNTKIFWGIQIEKKKSESNQHSFQTPYKPLTTHFTLGVTKTISFFKLVIALHNAATYWLSFY